MNPQDSPFFRRVIPVEPVENQDVREAIKPEQAISERGKDIERRSFSALSHLPYWLN